MVVVGGSVVVMDGGVVVMTKYSSLLVRSLFTLMAGGGGVELVVRMGENNSFFVKITPLRPTDWLGKSDITSKLYEFKRVLDAVRGGRMS